MAHRPLVTLAAALALAAFAIPGHAQEPPKAEATPKAEAVKASDERPAERGGMPGSTVRVSLVIARYQGDRKVASLPYTLVVGTGGARTRMRMGVDTPIPVTSFAPGPEPGGSKPPTSFQYKNVGTNVDCAVWERRRLSEAGQPETVYRLSLSVENSSAFSGPDARAAVGGVEGAPLFRRFETAIDVGLHDGQTLQTIASTDPVTGEVVKIDVTLNVVK
jgi:hypothetical protein